MVSVTPEEVELWPAGERTRAWRLESDVIGVTVTELGAHLVQVTMPAGERGGVGDRVVVSVDYPVTPVLGTRPPGYHGATVGRYANRIAASRFALDGVTHELASNEGANQLHGGPDGFDRRRWRGDAAVDGGLACAELELESPAGDQGFPGQLAVTARFELADDQLQVSYSATADAPTPVNLTNHLYWNLAGSGPLDGHKLEVVADRYLPVDEEQIPLPGPPRSVEGSRFDLRTPRSLAGAVEAGGIDHCYVLTAPSGPEQPSVELTHTSGRSIGWRTDQVGVQVYTGSHLPVDGRGVAIETQCLPDTPNRPDFDDATLRPGTTYEAWTTMTFRW